ncbi:MAG: tetratricopeptide repeat protein [Burkholderiales bacterium]|jgi:tetratricopeptide (TPR) repeat protein|nr:tetratricopeptide repeat protein [Burkholderiales bacterium]
MPLSVLPIARALISGVFFGSLSITLSCARAATPEEAPALESPAATSTSPSAQTPTFPPLTEDLFYRMMLADVALQRNDPALATQTYLEIAEKTKNVWFVERASESALVARDPALLKKSLTLWQKLDPKAERPKKLRSQTAQWALAPLKTETDPQKLREALKEKLREAQKNGDLDITLFMLTTATVQLADKNEMYSLVRDLSKPYGNLPEAHYAPALAAFIAASHREPRNAAMSDEQKTIANEGIKEVDTALAARGNWEEALHLKALLLDITESKDAAPWLKATLAAKPDAKNLWIFLARALVRNRDFPGAREWFYKIWQDTLSDDALTAVAAVTMQINNDALKNEFLEDVRQKGTDAQETALLFLYAQLSEDAGRFDEAISWYRQVGKGESLWSAQWRIAQILERQKKYEDAILWLHSLPATTRDEIVSVAQMESALLKRQGEKKRARDLLEKTLKTYPDAPELLLNLALIVEEDGEVKRAIALLRQAADVAPDAPLIQNALGYTLADHGVAVDEGIEWIKKALEQMPNEGSFVDSMGWALYRKHDHKEALSYLFRAYSLDPDPEIAAHLGEVLWVSGRRDEARETWRRALTSFDETAIRESVLYQTIKRFDATLLNERAK